MNRLANETSPYLKQHAHNPVDWYPWGEEALARARAEGKPIFVSIGYSACHWCHVMERESFENDLIAATLNAHFVCVKVDREERPDLDNLYMDAVQVMNGQGGWPMSVFLTPQLEPFFAGTYFPPEDRWGRPGFAKLLEQLIDVWSADREKVSRVTQQIRERLELMARTTPGDRLDRAPLDEALRHFGSSFDPQHAGFGDAPKFPPSMALRCLLHVAADDDRPEDDRALALDIVEQTLVHMASGGMYDQIGGGFHRYSVDREWLVPHFEKMLYDNALLLMAYTEAFQFTGRPFYERIVRETVGYVMREMIAEGGAFFASQDADSEGVEGKFFVWTPDDVEAVLGADDVAFAQEYWDIEARGNFEGASIPNRLHAIASDWTLGLAELPAQFAAMRERLFAARSERVAPMTDEKIITAWNGLLISALARAGAVFREPSWLTAAAGAAAFLLDELTDDDGNLLRTYNDGRARFRAYLDDYACLAAALFDLFEATGEVAWLDESEALVDTFVRDFWDPQGGAFFFTAEHHTDLIVRQKESYDSATPSSNSVAAMTLLRVGVTTGRDDLRDIADTLLRAFYDQMKRMPQSLCEMIQALDLHARGPQEIVCVTPPGQTSRAVDAWVEYRPHAIIIDVVDADVVARIPAARDRPAVDDAPTVYVCRDGTCELPVHEI